MIAFIDLFIIKELNYELTICFLFRNIILIRHGQYNLDGKTDSERYSVIITVSKNSELFPP